jgi:hypothetical protein
MSRSPAPKNPMTLGNMRAHGVRSLSVSPATTASDTGNRDKARGDIAGAGIVLRRGVAGPPAVRNLKPLA